MKAPLVSWLMSVYNSGKTVGRAIDSMLDQTYQNFEAVIIIEHGCADNTMQVCAKYAKNDSRIQVIQNNDRLGLAPSLNLGLDLCKGRYIARIDGDDANHPERLEKQVEFMEKNPDIGVLGTACRAINPSGTYVTAPPSRNEDISASLLFSTCFAHPTIMLRAELFRSNNWKYPICVSEDYALWASLLFKTKMANLTDPLLDYNTHDEALTSTNFMKCRADSARISRETLQRELHLDTSDYPDAYFGWRSKYPFPQNIERYLIDGARLLKEVQYANKRLQKFDNQALYSVLSDQWRLTKRDVLLSSLETGFEEFLPDDICGIISDADSICATICNKVIIYGTGQYCADLIDKTQNKRLWDILAFCDSDPSKHGTEFYGKIIIAPEQISNYSYDYIIITSQIYWYEIRNILLRDYLIPKEKLVSLSMPVGDVLNCLNPLIGL